jgi:hypothetical protein
VIKPISDAEARELAFPPMTARELAERIRRDVSLWVKQGAGHEALREVSWRLVYLCQLLAKEPHA